MGSLFLNSPVVVNYPIAKTTIACRSEVLARPRLNIPFYFQSFLHNKTRARFSNIPRKFSYSDTQSNSSEDPLSSVQELRVPTHWLEPAKASEEAEWLRVTLHRWLDDEYCPEPTNVDISKVAADSFYQSLMLKRVDLGEILLNMAIELETISYQESFHGAFSSANAAVNLIIERIMQE